MFYLVPSGDEMPAARVAVLDFDAGGRRSCRRRCHARSRRWVTAATRAHGARWCSRRRAWCLVPCLLLFNCSLPHCQPRRALSLFSDAERKAHAEAAQESRDRVQHTRTRELEEAARAQQEAAAAREEAREARAEALALRQDNAQLDKQVPGEGRGRRLGSVSVMMS